MLQETSVIAWKFPRFLFCARAGNIKLNLGQLPAIAGNFPRVLLSHGVYKPSAQAIELGPVVARNKGLIHYLVDPFANDDF